MDSNIDLSFPEIKAKIKLDSQIDSKILTEGLASTRKAAQFQAEKNTSMIQNREMRNDQIKDSYFNSSLVPPDVRRDNNLSKNHAVVGAQTIVSRNQGKLANFLFSNRS